MSRIARIVAVSWLAAVFALSGGLWQVCAALAAVPPAAATAIHHHGVTSADPVTHPMTGQVAGHRGHGDHRTPSGSAHPGSTNPDGGKAPLCAQFCAMAGVVILNDTAARVGVRFTATPVVFEQPASRHIDGIAWLDPDIPKPIL
jgi:hypothetical protein